MNRVDRVYQRELINTIAMALAHGLLEEDSRKVQSWARRAERLTEVARNQYGDPAALALLDQAMAQSEAVAKYWEATGRPSPSAADHGFSFNWEER